MKFVERAFLQKKNIYKNKKRLCTLKLKWYIKISIASNVAIKYKGDTPIKYYGDV